MSNKRRFNKKKLILLSSNGLCFVCHLPLKNDITIEHIIPKYFWNPKNGSPNNINNLALSHKKCNENRFKEYFKYRDDAIGYIVKCMLHARLKHGLDNPKDIYYLFKTTSVAASMKYNIDRCACGLKLGHDIS